MKIYIEYVLLNNLAVNAMILYLVGVITRDRMSAWRMVLSAIIGMIYAVLLPYISFTCDIFVKIFLSMIMVAVAFNIHNIREYGYRLVLFYLVTFLFGGAVIGVGNMVQSDLYNILLYPSSLAATYISLIIMVMTLVARLVIERVRHYIYKKKYYYEVRIECRDNFIDAVGFLDSGNMLYNGISMVIVLDESIFDRIAQYNAAEPHHISIETISSASIVDAYRIDNIDIVQNGIHKNYKNIYGIKSNRKFVGYDILLHGEM